jgi:hypothetical protein
MPLEISRSLRIRLTRGPTEVIAGLKLKATNMIPMISSVFFSILFIAGNALPLSH